MTDFDEETLRRDLHRRPLPPEQPDLGRRSAALGRRMRRRRRGAAVILPVAAAIVGALALSPAMRETSFTPAAPAVPSPPLTSVVPPSPTRSEYFTPAAAICPREAAGDSAGRPDLTSVAIDRPNLPFLHMSWKGALPRTGTVKALFWATSADGKRSRQFVVNLLDRKAVEMYVRDLQTGEVETVDHEALSGGIDDDGVPEKVVNVLPTKGLSASFPDGSTRPLGQAWTWKFSLLVDGVVVDSCKASR